jgi:S1/P1 Nuclease
MISSELSHTLAKENLHSFWDTALVGTRAGTPSEIAARIQAITGEDRQQLQQGTPADWALESLAMVRTQFYRLPAVGEINSSYVEAARAVIRIRLVQAGVRLAWMLNKTFH